MNESLSDATSSVALEAKLLDQLRAGDEQALGKLFQCYRERLWRMVQFRMDRRLAARVDSDDVLQESFVNAVARIRYYLEDPSRSLFIWLRLIVGQTLIDVHRRHLGAEMRSMNCEVSLAGKFDSEGTSVSLAAALLGSITSPSQAAARAELSAQLRQSIAEMSPLDREIIALRHFEDLTNSEVAEALGIGVTAASNRYVRAISRLRELLSALPGFFE
jgi:RNA polymerase sigma-70 factor (ECF subfamily)